MHDQALYIGHNPVGVQHVHRGELGRFSSTFPPNKSMLDRGRWPSSASETPPTFGEEATCETS
jgi:hypothetical protein